MGNEKSVPPAPVLSEVLLREVLRVSGLLRQVQEPYFADFGISAAQWGILRVLQREELAGNRGLPLKTVSQRLLIQAPSVTGVVDRLERQGLVKRCPSSKDMRVRHLNLTPRGRNLMARVLEVHPERIRTLMAPLTADEQQTLFGLLEKLHHHLGSLADPNHGSGTDATAAVPAPRHPQAAKARPSLTHSSRT